MSKFRKQNDPWWITAIAGIAVGLFFIAVFVGVLAFEAWIVMLILGGLGIFWGFWKVVLVALLVSFVLSALGTAVRQ